MPQPPSQGPASSPPDRKRKQPTIASFFGKKPSSSQQSPSGVGSQPQPKPKERENAQGDKENKDRVVKEKEDEDEDEDEDEEVVAPAPKRARVNGSQDSGRKASTAEEQDPVADVSQKTDLSKFTSSPAGEAAEKTQDADADDLEAKRRQKEKEKLHQKFVKRLGGADCLIGIGSDPAKDTTGGTEEAVEAEDDEEPAKPAPKGKATKKGGSKLTPLEKQVIDIKKKHMDTILVVEVGYKFRFFGEDARVAARELSIVCIPGKMRYDERMFPLTLYYCLWWEMANRGFC